MNQLKILVLVGVSGSGKSTYVEELVKKHTNIKVFSSDEYRKNMFGSLVQGNQPGCNKQVHGKLKNDMFRFIRRNVNNDIIIVHDAMNLNIERRSKFFDKFKDVAKITCVYFDANIKTIESRQLKRLNEDPDKAVPISAVKIMFERLSKPQIGIDCHEIMIKN